MHQNATVAQSIVASCFDFKGTRRKIVLQDLDFSDQPIFEGFRRFGAEIVIVPSDDSICRRIDRLVDAIDEQTVLVPISLVLFRSASVCRTCGPSSRKPIASAPASSSTRIKAPEPCLDAIALGGLRGRRLGEVAVRRAGRGLSLRPARSDQVPAPVGRGMGGSHGAVRLRDGRHPLCGPDRALPERHRRTALYSARAGYEIAAEIGVPFARGRCSHAPNHRCRAGTRVEAEHTDGRPRTRRIGRHRRPGRAARGRRAHPTPGHRRLPSRRGRQDGAAFLQHRGWWIARWRRWRRLCNRNLQLATNNFGA